MSEARPVQREAIPWPTEKQMKPLQGQVIVKIIPHTIERIKSAEGIIISVCDGVNLSIGKKVLIQLDDDKFTTFIEDGNKFIICTIKNVIAYIEQEHPFDEPRAEWRDKLKST